MKNYIFCHNSLPLYVTILAMNKKDALKQLQSTVNNKLDFKHTETIKL